MWVSTQVGRVSKGDILGEQTLLLGTRPKVDIVCDSDYALVLRLPKNHLAATFISNPTSSAKFFLLLAVRMSTVRVPTAV